MSRARTTLAALCVLAVAGIASTGSTLAAPASGGHDGWLSVDGPVPLFDLGGLAPGAHGETEITVTNDMPGPASFAMRVVDLRSDDFGCNEPESEAGDQTCGQDEGELDDALQLTVRAVGSDGSDPGALRTDVLAGWADDGVEDASPLDAGARRTYVIAYSLPASTSNVVQSDRVSFALDLQLDQAYGTEVEGESFEPGAEATVAAADTLPRTGAPILDLIRIGATAIAVGCTLLLVVSWKRDRARLA